MSEPLEVVIEDGYVNSSVTLSRKWTAIIIDPQEVYSYWGIPLRFHRKRPKRMAGK